MPTSNFYEYSVRFYQLIAIFLCIAGTFILQPTYAQECPLNIDFEEGHFGGWKCYTGFTSESNGQNTISLEPEFGPVAGRQTMYSAYPSAGYDEYGGFPINCPNGSGHSIKLGNDSGGGQAEGISYEFTIPANENVYTLIYNYAVVFQDPSHLEFQQPRMLIEIRNVTDNILINCSSFTFFPNGSPLPGFMLSPISVGDAPIWYKDWSAVSINLDGMAGKKIRLFFKTADCTFRRHFGYAYIDVNSECSGRFQGASFCPDDTSVSVVAPYGYQEYRWYNSNFTQLLGTQQVLTFMPPPAVGTNIAVIVTPYNGYGCLDTLYTDLRDNLNIRANAGKDTVSCNNDPVPIGAPPRSGERYLWSPAAGLSDPSIANPVANPAVTTRYFLNTRSTGGGCNRYDTVLVSTSSQDYRLFFTGKTSFCLESGDSAVLSVSPTDTIQWYRDGVLVDGASQERFKVLRSGSYYARLANTTGCVNFTETKSIQVASVPVAGFTIPVNEQCLVGNHFIFNNNSSNVLGEMQYLWNFGDGTVSTTRDNNHVYTQAGIYPVTLLVWSNEVCADSSTSVVKVFQNPEPDFTANAICQNLPMQLINLTPDTLPSTIFYEWKLGNGMTSYDRNPPTQYYHDPGVYSIRLGVYSAQCPQPRIEKERLLIVERPFQAVRYRSEVAVEGLPLALHARRLGNSVLWSPPTGLDDPSVFDPVFNSYSGETFFIEIKTAGGCITVDTVSIKTVKNIAVYVPLAFTPNNDGINDQLRPVMYGINKLLSFKVFNRWGQLMFYGTDPDNGWDGNYKGRKQEMQTFVWIVTGIGADAKIYTRKGTSILMR